MVVVHPDHPADRADDGAPTTLTTRVGAEQFVSLVSFKRNGDPVAAPMWVAPDGDRLVMWTPADAWKVKRIRRNPHVTVTPCSRMGKIAPGAPVLHGSAEIVTDAARVEDVRQRVKRKYGFAFRVITLVEAIIARGNKERVAVVITPQEAGS